MTSRSISQRLSRKLVAGIGRDEGGGSCGDLEEDVVSEVVEAPDQGGARPCLLIKERLSEFLEGNGFGEHVEHGDQDLVCDGHGSPLRAPTRLQPVVLVLVVAALGPGGAGLNEGGLEVDVALAGRRTLFLAGALVIAGADPGPGGQTLGVAKGDCLAIGGAVVIRV